ncbi:MAG: uroporphyrinogen-III synthase [Pseudomonadota bacterium]|nr:uroporphyrinogen-III synthase [Pseudomonadota bacterium]
MSESSALQGRRIAVPEARQLGILVDLLRNRGAEVLQIPLVAILDAPDPVPVLTWIERFIAQPPDLFILLTGEGLKRLLDLAGRHGREEAFVAALGRVPKLSRGPKPERVLRTLGLQSELHAAEHTTAGIIASLATHELAGKRVAVQLYGEEPNLPLIDFLSGKGATADTVAPYVYASKEDETQVLQFIEALHAGSIDAVTFTSQPQYKRLVDVAKAHGLDAQLHHGLQRTLLAAVGPLVAQQLEDAGLTVAVMPDKAWFMKPLVTALMRHFERGDGTVYNPGT